MERANFPGIKDSSVQDKHEAAESVAFEKSEHRGEHPFELPDEGHTGQHQGDVVMHHNAHPHQAHSKGYGSHVGENHGLKHYHVSHDRRDKAAEHHPPKGLAHHNSRQVSSY